MRCLPGKGNPWVGRGAGHPVAGAGATGAGDTECAGKEFIFEERDLVTFHPEYADYRRRVPMLVPRLFRRSGSRQAEAR